MLHLAASLYLLLLAFGLCPDGSSEAETGNGGVWSGMRLRDDLFPKNQWKNGVFWHVILPSMNQPRGSSYLYKRESESDFSCLDGLCYGVLVFSACLFCATNARLCLNGTDQRIFCAELGPEKIDSLQVTLTSRISSGTDDVYVYGRSSTWVVAFRSFYFLNIFTPRNLVKMKPSWLEDIFSFGVGSATNQAPSREYSVLILLSSTLGGMMCSSCFETSTYPLGHLGRFDKRSSGKRSAPVFVEIGALKLGEKHRRKRI